MLTSEQLTGASENTLREHLSDLANTIGRGEEFGDAEVARITNGMLVSTKEARTDYRAIRQELRRRFS